MQNIELIGFALSPQQQRIFNLDANREGVTYVSQINLTLEGEVDQQRLRHVLEGICARHEMLRTRFLPEPTGEDLLQVITPEVKLLLEDSDDDLLSELKFDLASGAPLRAMLTRIAPNRCRLLLAMPSVAADARSLRIIAEELAAAYGDNTDSDVSSPVQYADVAEHFNTQLDAGAAGQQYWSKLMPIAAPNISSDYMRRSKGGGFCPVRVHKRISRDLLTTCRDCMGASYPGDELFVFSCWLGYLTQLTGESDFVVGYAADGRNMAELQGCIGPMERYLPVKTTLPGEATFSSLVTATTEAVNEALSWQMFLRLPADSFIPVCFSYYDAAWKLNSKAIGIGCDSISSSTDRFDLKLTCIAHNSDVVVELWYDAATFPDNQAAQLLAQYLTFVGSTIASPQDAIGCMNSSDPEERNRLLEHLANGPAMEHCDAGIVQRINDCARRHPENVAIATGQATLTYGELDQHAGQLARELKDQGVGPDVCVGLLLDRSIEMIVGLLAILKTGGAYLAIDPSNPDDRIRFILEDARPPVFLTQEKHRHRVPEQSIQIQLLDSILAPCNAGLEFECASAMPDDLAYVIYTSGSTGRPKGVLVTQRGLRNYVEWASQAYEFRAGGRTPLYSSLGFDLTVTSLWPTLVSGGCVEVVPEKEGIEWLAGRGVEGKESENGKGKQGSYEVLKATPSHLRVLKEAIGEKGEEIAERLVIGGEALRWEDVNYWSSQGRGVRVVNEYGPTETVVGSCVFEVGNEREAEGAVPIGRAIANTRVYVLDGWGKLSPSGAAGELYIGGEGVARGYLGQPGLTAERFVPDEYSGREGERLYRTGDKVRWRGDGELEYLGRLDNQVKIRGYRIELGEIEAQVAGYEGVRQTAVVVREDKANEPRLVAYVSFKPGVANGDRESLKDYLKSQLPEYMVPSAIVELAELPLTTNGKLDERALPSTALSYPNHNDQGISPLSFIEGLVARIWREVLQLEHVAINDDFFELGGHSLLGTRIIDRIRMSLGVQFPVRVLFECPTVSALARRVQEEIQAGMQHRTASIPRAVRTQDLPLSYAQQGLWFLDQLQPGNPAYNNGFGLRLRGKLNREAVLWSLRQIVGRHEILRTSFPMRNGIPVQRIADSWDLELPEIDLRFLPQEQKEKNAIALAKKEQSLPFNLQEGPLLRFLLLQLHDDDHLLAIIMHHVTGDGWSLAIMVREFSACYAAYIKREEPDLPDLDIQYADFSAWQREWLQGEVLANQTAYWSKQLADVDRLALPTDFPRNSVVTRQAEKEPFDLPRVLTDRLVELSRNEGATLFMVLLTAYQAVLARYAGNDDVVVGTDIANRSRVETEPLIGFFVNQLAIRTNFLGASTFREMLKRVRQSVLDSYLNQDLPFERVVDELLVERRPGRHPIFQVKLTLQNMPRQSFDLPDVDVDVISLADGPPKMDMILIVGESEEGLTGLNTYNSELYSAVTIRALTQLYRALLTVLATDAEMLEAPRPELFHATELKLRDGLQAASPLQPSRMRARVGQQAVDA